MMKTVIAVFTLCFAATFAAVIQNNDNYLDEYEQCLVGYGIDPDSQKDLNVEQLTCVGACYYRNLGVMKPDGTIDINEVESHFNEENTDEKELFFGTYNACKEKVACELVACMFEALKEQWGEQLQSKVENGEVPFPAF